MMGTYKSSFSATILDVYIRIPDDVEFANEEFVISRLLMSSQMRIFRFCDRKASHNAPIINHDSLDSRIHPQVAPKNSLERSTVA
jgi:hypothetical protein